MVETNIVIADDHHLVRRGIKSYFEDEPDLKVVAEASDGEQAVQLSSALQPEILLLDISMPKLSGMEAISKILAQSPDTKILILSMYLEEKFIQKCMEEGVHGYMHKGVEQYELISGVRSLLKGQAYYCKEVREVLANSYANTLRKKKQSEKEAAVGLTKREKQIVKYILDGLTSSEIGETLFISSRTVDTHRTNLMQKLKVKNVVELMKKVNKEGLLEE